MSVHVILVYNRTPEITSALPLRCRRYINLFAMFSNLRVEALPLIAADMPHAFTPVWEYPEYSLKELAVLLLELCWIVHDRGLGDLLWLFVFIVITTACWLACFVHFCFSFWSLLHPPRLIAGEYPLMVNDPLLNHVRSEFLCMQSTHLISALCSASTLTTMQQLLSIAICTRHLIYRE